VFVLRAAGIIPRNLITHNLALPQNVRRRLRKYIRILRQAREDADYRPGISIDRVVSLDCIRNADFVLKENIRG